MLAIAWGICLSLDSDPRLAFVRWSDFHEGTNEVPDALELASKSIVWKTGSLSLICSSPDQIRLAMKAQLPGPRESIREGVGDKATIFIGDIRRKLETFLQITDMGLIDTLISPPLSRVDLSSLASAFEEAQSGKVSVMTMETGTFMAARTTGTAIHAFSKKCFASNLD
ncbi:hypothetical protein [Microvirga arsenatis]|uniref:Uncharacterized protein n=1 Tax=Microvirga arsenatis TaxID=2692265 RepID=A0ABW9YV85_9HYPH|nr:hypothetical protein [Microvirga arsenatis]NBJ10924.1 hypothetical protein [Microvirga arsenatis]NBJ24179.1 hypothetical protein [Microvirga arsenatis]